MARYEYDVDVEDQDEGSSKTLLIAAGVIVGLAAGAAAAHKLGGWRGITRRLRRGRGPVFQLLRETISPALLRRLLQGGGGVVEMLLAGSSRRRRRRAAGAPYDPDLDEYEVEEWERAAAGVDQDDLHEHADDFDDIGDDDFDDADDDRAPSAEETEREVLEIFSQSRALRRRPIEIACSDDGVVTLRGVVHTTREARLARRLALSADGVESVHTDLEVREPQAS